MTQQTGIIGDTAYVKGGIHFHNYPTPAPVIPCQHPPPDEYNKELLQAVQALVQALQENTAGRQALVKYKVDARGAQIGVLGDNANVTDGIHFGSQK